MGECQEAFKQHFKDELKTYKKGVIVNLVDQSGKEKVIADAYLDHILENNSPDLTYITFDFHEYCRGMKFENVDVLTESIPDVIKDMRYCWVDRKGMICEQRSVFRVNCIDCLDRTNVVQTALARTVMEIQCRKLGLLPPDESLPLSCRVIYQQVWANNGDAISRQYAGTAALKGDFTRTGKRELTGVMKDGMNSANRYYLSRFKDAYRQAAIDVMLGNPISEELTILMGGPAKIDPVNEGSELREKEEDVLSLIQECKILLIGDNEHCLGGWGLIDCSSGSSDDQDVDTILLLTNIAYYVAHYDDEVEKVTDYQRIQLDQLESIDLDIDASSEPALAMYIAMYRLIATTLVFTGERPVY
ncbi:unnamed protein product [Owenia fusiformis]|uniref:Uncharacterized protein n=1 Tax=Owenia fusiformis TaxID=6347 RepID=A0A8S4NSN4_OWEFU|nr:unnamed protein product [Owenia fusiformis]